MKQHFFSAVVSLLFCAVTLHASDTSVDGIWYDFDNSNLTATVTYKGSIYQGSGYETYYIGYTGAVVIPETVMYQGTTYTVTSIGDSAFFRCTGLTSVAIPNSVTSIGEEIFYGCTGLTSIKVDTENKTYDSRENCNAIIETATNKLIAGCKTAIIPNSVTSIGDGAFSGCTGLASIYNYGEQPVSLEGKEDVFTGVDKSACTLYVPAKSLALYKDATEWKDFLLEAINGVPTGLDEASGDVQGAPRKVMENGEVRIVMPDGKRYGLTGCEVR